MKKIDWKSIRNKLIWFFAGLLSTVICLITYSVRKKWNREQAQNEVLTGKMVKNIDYAVREFHEEVKEKVDTYNKDDKEQLRKAFYERFGGKDGKK